MQLNDEQKQMVTQWVTQGCTLSELQKNINEAYNLSLSYMDVRLLVLDMNLQLKERATTSGAVDISKTPSAPSGPVPGMNDEPALPGGDNVSVTLDRVLKPGALVSGSVTFSDGVNAEWMLDQMGRLGLTATQPGYRPTPEDLQSFQEELSQLLQNRGL